MSAHLKKEYKKLVAAVKAERRKQGLPDRYEDIAKILGYDRSYFSTLMGKQGVVNEKHIKLLKLNFPFLAEKPKVNGHSLEDLIKALIVRIDKLIAQNEKK
jgi:hypothetical protein